MSANIGNMAPALAFLLSIFTAVVAQADKNFDNDSNSSVEVTSSIKTTFSCSGRPAGFYADIPSDCQIYHTCDEAGRLFSHACPERTRFQQRTKVCDHWYMVECDESEIESQGPTQTRTSTPDSSPSQGRKSHRHSQRVIATFPYQPGSEPRRKSSSKTPQDPTERIRIGTASNETPRRINKPISTSTASSLGTSQLSTSSVNQSQQSQSFDSEESQESATQKQSQQSSTTISRHQQPPSPPSPPSSQRQPQQSPLPSSQTQPQLLSSHSSQRQHQQSPLPLSQTQPQKLSSPSSQWQPQQSPLPSSQTQPQKLSSPSSQWQPLQSPSLFTQRQPQQSTQRASSLSPTFPSQQTQQQQQPSFSPLITGQILQAPVQTLPSSSRPRPPSPQQQPPLLSSQSLPPSKASQLIETQEVSRQSTQQSSPPPSPQQFSPSSPRPTTAQATYTASQTATSTFPPRRYTENIYLITESPLRNPNIPSQTTGQFTSSTSTNQGGVISQIRYVTPYREAKIERILIPPRETQIQTTPLPIPDKFTNNPYFESYFKTSFTITSPSSPGPIPTGNYSVIRKDEEENEENRIEIVIPDTRKMFYIPDSNYDPGDIAEGHGTVLVIDLPVKNSMKFQKVPVAEARNHDCPQCHPSFLIPGQCTPCVLIR